ncbi:uncharacterized protein LOC136016629 [Lathamus discolor]|uniref:uncharacterized protein LOC136016629 n=1 Tax=Lathamus discolor TaxID=678569 RepID=UPI0032B843FF
MLPNCVRCTEAALELQRGMLSPPLGMGSVPAQDHGTWQAVGGDLWAPRKRGCLSCHNHSSSSFSTSLGSPESLTDVRLSLGTGTPVPRGSASSRGSLRANGVRSALKMHVARKSLEVKLEALPVPVQLSQEQAVQQRGRRVLPKLIRPGQSQPLPRYRTCPWMQAKADAIEDTIEDEEVQRLWEDSNCTEELLDLLKPCPPAQLPQEHSTWGARVLGQAGTMGQPTEGRQELPSQHSPKPRLHTAGAAVCFSSQAPASKTGTSESLLHPHGQLPQREPFPWPLGSSSAQPALPKPDHRDGEPVKGPASASVPRKRDVSLQTNLTTTQGRREASPVDESQPTASTATVISRLVLSKEVHSKLEAHVARKCLEMEQRQPPAAARDSTATHRSLPKRLWDGARGGDPCLKPRCQTAQVAPQQHRAPLASRPVPRSAPQQQEVTPAPHSRAPRLQRYRGQRGTERPWAQSAPAKEPGGAGLQASSQPLAPIADPPAPSTSMSPGRNAPSCPEAPSWSRRHILPELFLSMKEKAESWSKKTDVREKKG